MFVYVQKPMILGTPNTPKEMDWSVENGENTDYSTSSPTPSMCSSKRAHTHQDGDSLSEEDDLSDEFSLLDSDEEKRQDIRIQHHVLQVLYQSLQYDMIDKLLLSFKNFGKLTASSRYSD